MKKLFGLVGGAIVALSAGYLLWQSPERVGAQQGNTNPGLLRSGTITFNHCVAWVDNFHVKDAGANCYSFVSIGTSMPATIANTQCGQNIQGTGPGTLTLPGAGTFPGACIIRVTNSGGRGITLSGFPIPLNPILYPNQVLEVMNLNGGWVASIRPELWRIVNAVQNFYIDPVAGSATNDGLAAAQPITVERAIQVLANEIDISGNSTAQFNYAAVSWTDHSFTSQGYHGTGTVVLNGAGQNNSLCTIQAGFTCFTFAQNAAISGSNGCGQYVVQNFGVRAAANGNFAIFVQGPCIRLNFGNMAFWGLPGAGSSIMGGQQGSTVTSNGGNNYYGGAAILSQAVDMLDVHFTAGVATETCFNPVVTITIASPAVFTIAGGHNFTPGTTISFLTSGALPTGLTSGTLYYVIAAGLTATQFEVSTTQGGAAVNTSGTQSGTHATGPYFTQAVLVGHGTTLTGTVANQWQGQCFGPRYQMGLLSLLDSGGTTLTLPGSIAGSPAAGADVNVVQ